VYGDTLVADAFMGAGRAEANIDDLRRALLLYRTACGVQIAAVLVLISLQV
jgi:adenosylcobinamide-phosphate synthase